jgi:DNA repair exonuclease SbcCD ATPase subunit
MIMEQTLEELHEEWQLLAEKNGKLLASKDEIEERMATDARALAEVDKKLQALERNKLQLLPRLADAAMAAHGACPSTGASALRPPALSHMR